MLDFEQFKDYVREYIADYLPDELQDAEIEFNNVLKNNGRRLTGLVCLGAGKNVAPTIYLEPLYEDYRRGESLGSILKEIADISAKNQLEGFEDMAVISQIHDFAYVKPHLTVCLINAQKNEQLLAGVPHTMHEDLAAVYKIMLNVPGEVSPGTVMITKELMESWKIGLKELDAAARENAAVILPPICKPMTEIMQELLRADGMPEELIDSMVPEIPESPLWVITNEQKTNGAAVIIYSDVLQELSERVGQNLFVLPSSTHEVLALPEFMSDPEELAEMVSEINATEVSREEQLSDHVYYYNAEDRSLTLADTSVEELGLVSEPEVTYQTAREEEGQTCARRGGRR